MFTAERAERILKAFYTGWDDRYGFYLDDGWIHVYRSFVLLARFRLIKKGDSYTFVNIQRSQEKPECSELAIEEAYILLAVFLYVRIDRYGLVL